MESDPFIYIVLAKAIQHFGILDPDEQTEPVHPTVEAQSLSQWITGGNSDCCFNHVIYLITQKFLTGAPLTQ